ncbi:hypothetical protein C8P68_101784 [Mucilaginibacter yixingensis]|uniref:Pectate lyase-like protein n=1 Tax=Mucilaginibacter yixingensis TaxID=1295612 RepID=A0A2T5JGI5_9SPHI|nr:hypothetical protein [Mucilaginibacter yixingensis]PTR01550.1 hypothetical protein C8P68_101784 [Mucilaginibacter yixingensis]
MKIISRITLALAGLVMLSAPAFKKPTEWQSKFVTLNADGSLTYHADEQGNTLPDFSLVGYHQNDIPLPTLPVVKTVEAPAGGDAQQLIQDAIDEVAQRPADASGLRGAILLKRGTYTIAGKLYIKASGIVLRGEGDDKNGTRIVATGKGQRTLLNIEGAGNIKPAGAKVDITDGFVPVGAKSFHVASVNGLTVGERIILYRPSTANWIHDLRMDQIQERKGTKQWQAGEYDLHYERTITQIEGNQISIDNPVVMQMETKYGGGAIYPYTFDGRIKEVGIENICFESEYAGDTDEDHGWIAVGLSKVENAWVRNVTSRYFGYACVSTEDGSRNVTVIDCKCLDAKSVITGGRRYSFNNTGQLNLFMNCHAKDGRHDYVTGAKVCGPNVFYNSTAKNVHADAGPHHRWASGTLYDNIISDGEINVQDRQYMGSGHGWSGVTQILWNCTAKAAAVQKPWVSGTNYNIGFHGRQTEGSFKGRENGEWEGQNKDGLMPSSLYMAQYKARHLRSKN